MILQLASLFPAFDVLHKEFGDPSLQSIYGAGQIRKPRAVIVFMNPTGKNISGQKGWQGLRAPWIGTVNAWKLLARLGVVDGEVLSAIVQQKQRWSEAFSLDVYKHVAQNGYYITNFAKCTQLDARPLANSLFRQYLPLFLEEMQLLEPQLVITLGTQVSSIILDHVIIMGEVHGKIEKKGGFSFLPTYYPVGQGQRNAAIMQKDVLQALQKLQGNLSS